MFQRRRYKAIRYQPGFMTLTSVQRPSGRGKISLRSRDIRDPPVIQPNLFGHQDDIDRTLFTIKTVLNIANSTVFGKYGARPFARPVPGEGSLYH